MLVPRTLLSEKSVSVPVSLSTFLLSLRSQRLPHLQEAAVISSLFAHSMGMCSTAAGIPLASSSGEYTALAPGQSPRTPAVQATAQIHQAGHVGRMSGSRMRASLLPESRLNAIPLNFVFLRAGLYGPPREEGSPIKKWPLGREVVHAANPSPLGG